MDAMENLLLHFPYEKISVAMLARKCGFSRQAFYKYYSNKDELSLKMVEAFCQNGFNLTSPFTWRKLVFHYLKEISVHKNFFYSVAQANDNFILFQLMYDMVFTLYKRMGEFRLKQPLSSELDFYLRGYCNGGILNLVQMLGKKNMLEVELLVQYFEKSMPPEIHKLLTGTHFPAYLLKSDL